MRMIWTLAALGALAACTPVVPDSAAGVGFDSYDKARLARDAKLAGNPTTVSGLPPAQHVSAEPLDATNLAAQTQVALAQSRDDTATDAVVQASPSNPKPMQLENAGISNENDFAAVGERRSIASDAERRAQNQAQYQVIQPTALPVRRTSSGPNIVSYALQTSNPIGTRIYRRIAVNGQKRFQRNCAKFASPDLAQSEFLSKGGPKNDRLGIDPDGDGYACAWDPRSFRKAKNG